MFLVIVFVGRECGAVVTATGLSNNRLIRHPLTFNSFMGSIPITPRWQFFFLKVFILISSIYSGMTQCILITQVVFCSTHYEHLIFCISFDKQLRIRKVYYRTIPITSTTSLWLTDDLLV